MGTGMERLEIPKLSGIGGVVFVSGLGTLAHAAGEKGKDDFFFVQMSDTHWGFATETHGDGPAMACRLKSPIKEEKA
jgi:hypothetical protein